MKLLKYILFTVALLAVSVIIRGQELKVDFFEQAVTDITARTSAVKDLNGKICALVKVSLPVERCEFSGNIIGSPEFHASEYWVYMTPGSKQLQIRCPGHKTLFADLRSGNGEQGVESGVTYRLELSGYENRFQNDSGTDPGANYLILDITPKSGLLVKVDGVTQSVDNGQVMAYLKYGPHSYQVEAEGYAPQEGTADIRRGDNTVVNVTLKSVAASLTVEPATADATVKINGQVKGQGRWTGQLAPGMYYMEVTKEGFSPYSETVELSQQANRVIKVPALSPLSSALNVAYKPIGAKIILDGKEAGVTPKVLYDLPIGSHKVSIEKEGYQSFTSSVDITEGNTENLEGKLLLEYEDIEVLINQAIQVYEEGNYTKAYELFLSVSDDKVAQNYLGLMYTNGFGLISTYGYGVETNDAEALKWYRKAAEQGNAAAQNNIGVMYQYGRGVKQDYNEAVGWYRRSAEKGNTTAQNNIGSMYEHGYGVSKNYMEALNWYRRAAEQGDATAQNNIGAIYEYGHSVIQNYTNALEWYQRSADQGNISAYMSLGRMYEHGYGVEQNYAEALKWYRKAAEGGHIAAYLSLGRMYEHGYGVDKNYDQATHWYGKGAQYVSEIPIMD